MQGEGTCRWWLFTALPDVLFVCLSIVLTVRADAVRKATRALLATSLWSANNVGSDKHA
jgi:hypothetical protein